MLTKELFLVLIKEIDQEISDLSIHQRPLHAFSELAMKIDPKAQFKMIPDDSIGKDDYSNDALCEQVHRWYKSKYGDRIKIHMGPGSYLLIIENEPWEVIYPLCYGQNNFIIDSSNLLREKRYAITPNGLKIPSVNILWHVKEITQEIASSLSELEKQKIFFWKH